MEHLRRSPGGVQSFLLSYPSGAESSTDSQQRCVTAQTGRWPAPQGLCPLGSLTMWLMIRALGPCSLTLSLDRLKVKGWSSLPMWSRSRRNLNPTNQVRFPSHQSCGFAITYHYQQELTLPTFPQERRAGSSLLGTLLNSASASLPLTDFNLCPFTVKNHNHEQSSFQVSSKSSYWVIKHIAQQSPNFTNTEKESFPETLVCTWSLHRIGPALPAFCMDGARTSVGRWIWSHYLHSTQKDRNSSLTL